MGPRNLQLRTVRRSTTTGAVIRLLRFASDAALVSSWIDRDPDSPRSCRRIHGTS